MCRCEVIELRARQHQDAQRTKALGVQWHSNNRTHLLRPPALLHPAPIFAHIANPKRLLVFAHPASKAITALECNWNIFGIYLTVFA